MNPLKWVRWKIVIALTVVFGLFYLLGLDPMTEWQINSLGSNEKGARWSVTEVGFGLLAGDVELFDLLVSAAKDLEKEVAAETAKDGEEKFFNADEVNFEVSVAELSRKRFVIDEMGLVNPHMEMHRRADGSTNMGDLEGSETEKRDEKTPEDWVRSAIEWYEKLQKIREKLPSGDDEKDTETERERQEKFDLWQRKVEYPFRDRPTYLVRSIYAKELEVTFADEGDPDSKIPSLTEGVIEITDLSSNPSAHDKPIRLSLEGKLAGSPLSLQTTVDFTGATSVYSLEFAAESLPVSVVEAFIGDSLPVSLAAGNIGIAATLSLDGDEGIMITPKLFFQGVKLAEKPGENKVAGLDAGSFVKAFNEASGALGQERLEIADLTISGTLSSPKFQWGNTVTDLVRQGGIAFANAQIEKGKALAKKEIDKGLDKVGAKLGSEIDKALDKSGVGDTVKGVLGDILPGKKDGKDGAGSIIDSVGEKAGGFLRGLGGDKKKD
jgi:hypothetical protein